MRLIAFVNLTIDGQIAGGMAVYDNVTTKISADYAEISYCQVYDKADR